MGAISNLPLTTDLKNNRNNQKGGLSHGHHFRWKPSVKTKGESGHRMGLSRSGSEICDSFSIRTRGCGGSGSLLNAVGLGILLLICCPTLDKVHAYSIHPQVDRSLGGGGMSFHEPVFYDPTLLLDQHLRKKREAKVGGHEREAIHFTLHAKSRDFHLVLEPDRDILHPQLEVVTSSSTRTNSGFDPDRVFRGQLADDPGSRVEGLITSEGHWDGTITTSTGERFHIEPANRYKNANPPGWSTSAPGILYEEEMLDWPQSPFPPSSSSHPHHHRHEPLSHPRKNSSRSRSRRATLDPRRKTCMLYLQADHLFHDHLGSEEAAINMMTRHIQRVNEIYRVTDFDGDGLEDGISFMIKRIKVHTSSSSPDYKYLGDYAVIKFLERFSEGDYESFCLAYMFTFRDFEGGTLGLAWTGDLKNAGGVCERKGHFRGGLKSLNTGIITLLNYGKVVTPAVSYVTLAHEIGHNFGAPHDPENERECVPGGRDGNFIMFARATAGDQKNNLKFSPCSLRSIRPVLAAKARHNHGCFTQPQQSICGNREVERGEECDCGWEEDCRESCCWPNRLNPPPDQVPCTLKPRVACSPSQGPCCSSNCSLTAGAKCRGDNGCRHAALCSGLAPSCPPSVHKPNRTVCGDGANVCFMGECTGSICLAYGLESCQCSPQPWDSPTKLCELCCKKPGEGEPCLSSFDPELGEIPEGYAKPGSPCKNYTGYCDSYRSCREVDPSGPLATLRNLLLADEGLSAIAHWVDDHWWAVISFLILLIAMMVLTAQLCGKQAKKKLRKITILHSNVDAIQVERSYWDEGGEEHVIHPAAVRKKIPLRKKIREKKKNKGGGGRGGGNKGRRGRDGGGTTDGLEEGLPQPLSTSLNTTTPTTTKENKAPRYGTLWRKRRAERSRLAGVSQGGGRGNRQTDPQQSTSSSGEGVKKVEESFDLVQLNTPPIYPNLNPFTAVSTSSVVPSSSGSGNPTPTQQQQQQQSHQYEAKTVILPSNPGGRRKRGGSRRPSSVRESGGVGVTRRPKQSSSRPTTKPGGGVTTGRTHVGKEKPTTSSRNKPSSSTTTTPTHKKQATPTPIKPKTTMQIVYTPPFSVKVVHVPILEEEGPSTSTPQPPLPHSSAPTNSQNAMKPIPQRTEENGSKTKSANSEASQVSPAILQTPLPPIPASPPPIGGPPPYQTPPHHEKVGKKSSLTLGGSFLSKNKGLGGGGSGGGGGGEKRSGGGKKKRKEKGELRVLIPPGGHEGGGDDDVDTPITPGS